jgi:hypothetical protein
MNKLQILEILGIICIIIFQFFVFIKTYKKIKYIENIFPDLSQFAVKKYTLSNEYLKFHPADILANINEFEFNSNLNPEILESDSYTDKNSFAKHEDDNSFSLDLVMCQSIGNATTDTICSSLNTYLIRNRGIASDFNLIKDIVERNTNAELEEVERTINLPLYLGLIGTFLGIIIGLAQISSNPEIIDSAQSNLLEDSIPTLLNSVTTAMLASLFGLGLMVINSGYTFKRSIKQIEKGKNKFYTFIQIELLPILNQNINSTLYSLQNNLYKFNDDFKSNIKRLNSIMGKNYDSIVAQEKILSALDKIDITSFAKANVLILKELRFSTEKLSQFNLYINSLNELLETSSNYTGRLNELITRTDNFNQVSNHLVHIFEENKQLMEFLRNHYNSLDNSSQLINKSVSNVNLVLEDSLNQLKVFTQERISELQKITLKELDLMQNQYPEKWKNLDNLSYLISLNKDINDIKISNARQLGSLQLELSGLNKLIEDANTHLETIKRNSSKPQGSAIIGRIKKLFSKKVF